MSDKPITGGCQCGAVRYVIADGFGRATICHCRMCQRALGNAVAPLVTAHGLSWSRGEPKRFRSSNKVQRGFCADCGTPLSYEPEGFPPEIAIATLDQPELAPPVLQLNRESELSWFRTLPELPTQAPSERAKLAPFFAGLVSYQAEPPRDGEDE